MSTAPPSRGPWRRILPSPAEQLSDEQADLYAEVMAPIGWVRSGPAIQGTNAHRERVIAVCYTREEPQEEGRADV